MQNILVTGANRGIGLEFVKQYLAAGSAVWACYRQNKGELENISNTNLHLLRWDVSQPLLSSEREKLPSKLHLLINNAGVYGDKGDGQSILNINAAQMSSVFAANAIGPVNTVQALLQQLKNGEATIANMSSKMGSSADNSSGGAYAYRASKAALCTITKSMAVDLAPFNIQTIALHPGWVQTDMTNHTGLLDTPTSASGLIEVISNIKQYNSGAFVAYDGQQVPY